MPGYELFDNQEREAVNEIFDINGGVLFAHGFEKLRKGIFKVREFENSIKNKFNISYAQAVSSCTAALRISLASIDLNEGDEVIMPSFTFVATAEAIIEAGGEPVIVDIDESFNMCPIEFENAITKKTKAVIVVHMMSSSADMDKILEISKKYNIKIIEDAAWGVGASYKGKPLGTIGDIGCYSFDAGKCISTGEGGMIVTNNKELFERSRSFHDHGHEYSTEFSRGEEGAIGRGFNFRITELQAAIGIVQLKKLETIVNKHRENKKYLKKSLIDNNFPYKFRRHNDPNGEGSDALFFTLENKERASIFVKELNRNNIYTKNVPDAIRWHFAKHWDHILKKYNRYQNLNNLFIKSSNLLESSVALPIFIKTSFEDIEKLSSILVKISKKI